MKTFTVGYNSRKISDLVTESYVLGEIPARNMFEAREIAQAYIWKNHRACESVIMYVVEVRDRPEQVHLQMSPRRFDLLHARRVSWEKSEQVFQ